LDWLKQQSELLADPRHWAAPFLKRPIKNPIAGAIGLGC